MDRTWQTVDSAPEDTLVETCIMDEHGATRNEGKLIRKGRLWWTSDRAMYVYYKPTHWRSL